MSLRRNPLRWLLLGESVELRSPLSPPDLASRIAAGLDRPVGHPYDEPGPHNFVGSVSGVAFWVRHRRAFPPVNGRPSARGRIVPDGQGSVVWVWWTDEPWARVFAVAFIGAIALGALTHVHVGVIEVGVVAWFAFVLLLVSGAARYWRGPIHVFLADRAAGTEPVTGRHPPEARG